MDRRAYPVDGAHSAAGALRVSASHPRTTVCSVSRSSARRQPVRLSANNIGGIALSPDGRTAAYVASGQGKTGLWVHPLDGTTARLIAGTEGAAYPFWSPDNKSVAFLARRNLQRVDLAGGPPVAICDVPDGRGGTWSSDGQILFGTRASGLFRVPASGGTSSPLTTLDASTGERAHRWPQVLPGGRFLYLVRGEKENRDLCAPHSASRRSRMRLLTTDTNALYAPGGDGKGYLLWADGGNLVAQEFNPEALKLAGEPHPVADPVASDGDPGSDERAAVSTVGVLLYSASNFSSQFAWLDRKGKPLGVVGEPGEYTRVPPVADGHRIITSRSCPELTICGGWRWSAGLPAG